MESSSQKQQAAQELMDSFADRTGLVDQSEQRLSSRYLWTDAFAVCNFLGLAAREEKYNNLAKRLVTSVHESLGQFRPDDQERHGTWLSYSSPKVTNEDEARAHPTAGGLRIGKPLPERHSDEPQDPQMEWDRDGQYFHCLTKWMVALEQMSRFDPKYHDWAVELALVAADKFLTADKFVFATLKKKKYRIHWKMSIDLTRPQVSSMGERDPIDGYITISKILSASQNDEEEKKLQEIQELFRSMIGIICPSDDPLGIGGMLVDAYRLEQLQNADGVSVDSSLLESLLEEALVGLDYYVKTGELSRPPHHRVAFLELGLSIGLHAIERIHNKDENVFLKGLKSFTSLANEIEETWMNPENQSTELWKDQRDINEVMLATSLHPDGFLA